MSKLSKTVAKLSNKTKEHSTNIADLCAAVRNLAVRIDAHEHVSAPQEGLRTAPDPGPRPLAFADMHPDPEATAAALKKQREFTTELVCGADGLMEAQTNGVHPLYKAFVDRSIEADHELLRNWLDFTGVATEPTKEDEGYTAEGFLVPSDDEIIECFSMEFERFLVLLRGSNLALTADQYGRLFDLQEDLEQILTKAQ